MCFYGHCKMFEYNHDYVKFTILFYIIYIITMSSRDFDPKVTCEKTESKEKCGFSFFFCL